MKQFFIFLISLYQLFVSPLLHQLGVGGCRYPVSCSEYTKQSITKYGAIKGSLMGLKRLSTCHPFQKNSVFGIM